MIVPVAALAAVPQFEQNRAPEASVAPHAAQLWLRPEPHSEQNFAPALFAEPQVEQTTVPSRLASGQSGVCVRERGITIRAAVASFAIGDLAREAVRLGPAPG
jgi:hypothetical protein